MPAFIDVLRIEKSNQVLQFFLFRVLHFRTFSGV